MPLLDHFHPPLSLQRHWESFHTTWASTFADALNEDWLPPGFFAEEQVTAGGRVEIDVATFTAQQHDSEASAGGVATMSAPPQIWAVPEPSLVIPAVEFEEFSVRIYNSEGGPKLVAAIELVSPANKDRPASRRAFVTKCAGYLQQQISLVVIDVVTSRSAELYMELLGMLGWRGSQSTPLFSAAFRQAATVSGPNFEGWYEPLQLGDPLPKLPLFITADFSVPLDLESTYSMALLRRRIGN